MVFVVDWLLMSFCSGHIGQKEGVHFWRFLKDGPGVSNIRLKEPLPPCGCDSFSLF